MPHKSPAHDFQKLLPGDSPSMMTHRTFNYMIDEAAARAQSGMGVVSSDEHETDYEGTIVLVLNSSGGDLDRFSVVGIDSPLIASADNLLEYQNFPRFAVVTPDIALHARRFGILLAPIASGRIGRMLLVGAVAVQIKLDKTYSTGEKPDTAGIIDADATQLLGNAEGVIVLDCDVGDKDDTVWGRVLLPCSTPCIHPFELYDDIAPGGTAAEAWPLDPDTLARDEEADKVEVNDGILGDVRALGSNTKATSTPDTGARGFYTTIGGVNQIVSIQRLAKLIRGTGPSGTVAANASYQLGSPVSLDDGQLPVLTDGKMTVTNYSTALPTNATNVTVVADGAGGYRTLDAPCP